MPPSDPTEQTPAAGQTPSTLAELRAEIDRIDDAIHDLLMRRGAVVERVGREGGKGGVALRPGREARIIRRLLARHEGALPARVLPRMWRELLAATTAMQGSYVIAVCEPDPQAPPAARLLAAAREHFGALTPMRVHRTPAQALAEVSGGAAIACVLPMPREEDPPGDAWWTALMQHGEPRLHVVARLPFWARRPDGVAQSEAYVVTAAAPDASGRDRSLIGLELDPAVSRARLSGTVAAAGFQATNTLLRREPAGTLALLEVDGLVADGDPRLAALPDLSRPPVVLGAYAVPEEGEPG